MAECATRTAISKKRPHGKSRADHPAANGDDMAKIYSFPGRKSKLCHSEELPAHNGPRAIITWPNGLDAPAVCYPIASSYEEQKRIEGLLSASLHDEGSPATE